MAPDGHGIAASSTRTQGWWLRHRGRIAFGVVTALLLSVFGVVVPANAIAGVTISKGVVVEGGAPTDSAALAPGDEFSFVITMGCSDDDCPDATITDPIPPELAGFEIVSTTVTPGQGTATYATCDGTTVTDDCTLTVDFTEPIPGGTDTGLPAGGSGGVIVTMRVPDTLPPTWPSNGVPITNTATGDSPNAVEPAQDPAAVTVDIPVVVATAATKDWSPSSQLYNPGEISTITITTQNTSNTPADSLVLTEPTSAVDGATSLAPDNPFLYVDFDGFGAVTFPAGATQVQVDAYVYDPDTGTWGWVEGTPGADPELPGGVDPEDVGGLRFTFTDPAGAVIDPGGTPGAVPFTVAQRADDRESGASLVDGAAVTNSTTGTVTVPGEDPASAIATDDFTIGPLDVAVDAGKTITPARIAAGETASAVLTAQNTSNGPLNTLTVSDLDFFTEDVTFDGFTTPIAWPSGTTSATITWHYSDGSTVVNDLPNGSQPTPPAAPGGAYLTGFEIEFDGSIPPQTQVSIPFTFAISSDFVDETQTAGVTLNNTTTATGTNPAGTATDSATAPVQVFFPDISLDIDKTILPSAPVNPGATVTASLPTTTSTDSAFVTPTDIVVTDSWDGSHGNFWNAFDPVAIAPTTVPAGATMTVEYTTDGTTWQTYEVVTGETIYQTNIPPGAQSTIVGLRFSFHNDDGFPQGTTVTPNITFQARSTLRDDGTLPAVPGGDAESYTNTAIADGSGTTDDGTAVDPEPVEASDDGQIIIPEGAGDAILDKRWVQPTDLNQDLANLESQSGELAATRVLWGVTSTGFSSATLNDPASDFDNPAVTVFQAFDLKQVLPVSFTTDPLLQWDLISSVQLYYGGAWHEVAAPAGGWMDGTGFIGYVLTDAESAQATGVQLTVLPNDAARTSTSDPTSPPPGSGIATSSAEPNRVIDLLWQLRNVVRDTSDGQSQWVTADRLFNASDAGVIANTAAGTGVLNGATVGPRYDSDTVSLLDQPPGTGVTKATENTEIVVPNKGDVPASGYPTNEFTITAQNTSSALASYVRVTDPMPCDSGDLSSCLNDPAEWAADPYAGAAYDAATNPFERFDLTGVSFTTPAGVDRTTSHVTLWHRAADGTLSTTVASIDATQALGEAQLADVVGVSVVYQGTDPSVTGGTIGTVPGNDMVMSLATRVRVDLRSQPGTAVGPFPVVNLTFAQGYDPVLYPDGQGSQPSDSGEADVILTAGKLGVEATKQISPDNLLEVDRDDPVTATLTATSGTGTDAATVPTNEVRLEDTDADFWNAFRLDSLGAVTLPAGADQAKVDVQVNGSTTWVEGVSSPTAALPASVTDPSTITGIRFTFDRADGGLFSNTAPPAPFTAAAVLNLFLRDTLLSGDPILFPSTVGNTLDAVSHRTDQPAIFPDATSDGSDDIALDPGTHSLDVSKTPSGGIHTVLPGTSVPWAMTFTNTGTGFLTVDTLVDTLPNDLDWDQVPPTFSTTAAGTLSIDPDVEYAVLGRTLTFTWPDGGDRMSPGETFTITLGLILQPGLGPADSATNQMVVTTDEDLTSCSNISGNGQGTVPGLDAGQCGTTNFVSPVAGSGIVTVKGVRGDVVDSLVTGATNTVDPAQACVPASDGFYRYPCVANTRVGGTDLWRVTGVNSGTVPLTSLVLVDPLPHPGDVLLATGSARGSTWRPVVDPSFPLDGVPAGSQIPVGTTVTTQVTTDADVCTGAAGTAWNADSTCSGNVWIDLAAFTGDWSDVTGVRALFDFSTSVAGSLAPGGSVSIEAQTINVPLSAASPDGAPTSAPVGSEYAWNQNGATAVPTSGAPIQLAPLKAGVMLLSGPLEITKTVSGDAAQYAPESFPFTVGCTVAGVPVDLGAQASVDVPTNDSVIVTGIPIGADCDVTEAGDPGSNGETARTPQGTQTVTILQDADPTPAAQVVTVDNRYDYGDLSVAKAVDTDANVGEFGPFQFHIACTAPTGGTGGTVLDEDFTLTDGETYDAPDDTLPVGSTCLVSETDSGSAGSIAFGGDGVTDNGDGTATATVGAEVEITTTNTFPVGLLEATKQVTGDGADRYGSGPFVVHAICSWPGLTTIVYTGEVELVDGQTEIFTLPNGDEALLPVGTTCLLTEPTTGGSTGSPTFTDAAGNSIGLRTVTITDRGDPADPTPVQVTVANPFETGQISVVKDFEGRGTEIYGAGPFTVRLECSYDKDGVETPITWDGEDHLDIELSEANGYQATVDDLLVGSECEITEETITSGATDVVIGDAVIVPAAGGDPVTITVTNTFPAGSLLILKQRTGAWQQYGAGPFTLSVACEWTIDGVLQPIPVPGGPSFTLSSANGYRVVVDLLPVGAECAVTETDAGAATSTSYSPVDGTVTVIQNDEGAPDSALATVIITNDFDPGKLSPTGVNGTALLVSSFAAGGLSLAGLAVLILMRRRRRVLL